LRRTTLSGTHREYGPVPTKKTTVAAIARQVSIEFNPNIDWENPIENSRNRAASRPAAPTISMAAPKVARDKISIVLGLDGKSIRDSHRIASMPVVNRRKKGSHRACFKIGIKVLNFMPERT
jgi:hypothetical protein